MDPWAKVRVAGVVEGYRVRIFKGGGGKVAFFTLEDPQGRIEVKCREKFIDLYEAVLANGEPVLVSGKLQFPQVEEGEEDTSGGPREPTLLLDEVHPLADAIRAATRSVHVKLPAARTRRDQIERLRSVLEESPGSCPVQLTILLDDGAEALFALPSTRVEPSDLMLARLEKLFGERVVELR
jgi:DNA polymerase-3 subunit alpha